MAADTFGRDYKKALDAALAVEVFHNFTLIHDDIMDAAPLRRGHVTVHEKWNTNIGILSGDAMLIQTYQYLEGYDAHIFKRLIKLLSKTALEVCEGQQMDVDFEDRNDVSIDEYITMITFKTSVLIAAALKMGAIVANVDDVEATKIYEFGLNLGLAFQLQDDYLDVFGNPETFGKQIGGDIIENKKTFLYLTALKNATQEEKELLEKLYSNKLNENQEKIEKVKSLFVTSLAADKTIKLINQYTQKAFEILETISTATDKRQVLKDFGNTLMKRDV